MYSSPQVMYSSSLGDVLIPISDMKTIKYDDRIETHSSNDLVAIEYKNGDKAWYKEGFRHRIDGPAEIYINGDKFWYKEGELHRLGGPAIEYSDGDKIWYKEGKRHRIGGPAVEWNDGSKCWYEEDEFHRLDGPAKEYIDGYEGWYYKGKRIDCKSIEEFLKIINLKVFW